MGFSIQKARGSGHLGLYFFLHFITNIPMYFPQTRGLTEFLFVFQKQDFFGAFAFTVGYSIIFVVASCTLVLYQPAAAGSGIPEIIGFLNGTKIKDIFKLQTLIVKFLSCAFAVGAGMPVGYEGPMIHLGSLAAAGISQFKSGIFHLFLNFGSI